MGQRSLQLRYRIISLAVIIAITFAEGAHVYFAQQGTGEGAHQYFLAAALMFPTGFNAYIPCGWTTWLVFGWMFYALCIVVLLANSRIKPFAIVLVIMLICIAFNLHGCSHTLVDISR